MRTPKQNALWKYLNEQKAQQGLPDLFVSTLTHLIYAALLEARLQGFTERGEADER